MQTELDRIAGNLVRNEVHLCLSSLVATLAGISMDARPFAGGALCDQAADLCAPLDDWEEALIERNCEPFADKFGVACWRDGEDGSTWSGTPREVCEAWSIGPPYQREIFEHWAVSQRLAEDLQSLGERVDTDFAGLCVWGRTTTGQAIEADHVIRQAAQLVIDRTAAIVAEVA